MKTKKPVPITTLDGSNPAGRTWEEFLASDVVTLTTEIDGVKMYSHANCHHLLFPNNTLVLCYGFWGRALMAHVKSVGWETALNNQRSARDRVQEAMIDIQRHTKAATV